MTAWAVTAALRKMDSRHRLSASRSAIAASAVTAMIAGVLARVLKISDTMLISWVRSRSSSRKAPAYASGIPSARPLGTSKADAR